MLFRKLFKKTVFLTGLLLTVSALANPNILNGDTENSVGSPIDYRHMGLYQLKQNLYYNPSIYKEHHGSEQATVKVEHHHSHDHWGWGFGSPYWSWESPPTRSRDSKSSESFTDRVKSGVTSVAVVATIMAIAYGGYKTFTLAWPFIGAASLTAIELPANSPWRISGYRIAKGKVITLKHFSDDDDAREAVREGEMFDRSMNVPGRFLLVDQENWWGLTDSPMDIDVTFTRAYDDGTDEKITINFTRSVTNGLKSGTITTAIMSSVKHTTLKQPYRNARRTIYPSNFLKFDWSHWYHQPSRIILDFVPIGT